jgi:sulfur-oxidizing protein SoxZ
LAVTYDGAEIFRGELFPGIAANPSITFTTRATKTGDVVFTWIEDSGERTIERRKLTVEG